MRRARGRPVLRALARALALALALGLAACTTTPGSATAITGLALDELGATYLATGTLLNQQRAANQISEVDYLPWARFARRFRVVYRAAVAAYEAGATDDAAIAAVRAMQPELGAFLIQAARTSGRAPERD